jgi:acid stress chaperone HdeB
MTYTLAVADFPFLASLIGNSYPVLGGLTMRIGYVASGLLTLSFAWPVQAQLSLDVSKVTCDQFVHSKVGSPRTFAAWLSGYYNGKRNNQTVDPQQFEANLSRLTKFCYQEKNFKLPVMDAVEAVLGK